jgi:hypothetical protein
MKPLMRPSEAADESMGDPALHRISPRESTSETHDQPMMSRISYMGRPHTITPSVDHDYITTVQPHLQACAHLTHSTRHVPLLSLVQFYVHTQQHAHAYYAPWQLFDVPFQNTALCMRPQRVHLIVLCTTSGTLRYASPLAPQQTADTSAAQTSC